MIVSRVLVALFLSIGPVCAQATAAETIGAALRRERLAALANNPVDAAINTAAATLTANATIDATHATKLIYANVGSPGYAPSQVFRWRGGVPSRKYNGAINYWMGTPVVNIAPATPGNWSSANSNGYTAPLSAAYSSVEFLCECQYLQLAWLGNGSQNGVFYIIDGQYLSDSTGSGTASTSGSQYHHLNFGSRGRHRVMVEWSQSEAIQSVASEPTGSLGPFYNPDNFTVGFIGDSLVAGQTPSTISQNQDWPARLMHLMGWPDIAQVAIGGTGYVNAGNSTNYAGHFVADLAAVNAYRPVGALVFWGSTNDKGQTQSAVQSAAQSDYAAARNAYPNAPIFVFGSTDGSNNLSAQLLAVENGVAAAVAQRQAAGDTNICFIPVSTAQQPWIVGTGYQGATNGSGNSDFDISGDQTHPTVAGYLQIARRAALGISNCLQSTP